MRASILCYIRWKATVDTWDPSTPPNIMVGYVRTWSMYRKIWDTGLAPSSMFSLPNFLLLKSSTSCRSSSFVWLHDVTTTMPPGSTKFDTDSQYIILFARPSGCNPMASKVPLSVIILNFLSNFVSNISSTKNFIESKPSRVARFLASSTAPSL